MPRLDPAIRHAITPVEFNESKLHRARLVDAIHAEFERKLIVISAPAGYGKTTLLADFSAHTDIPTCWVRLSDANQDVMRLAESVLASIMSRFRRMKGELDISRLATAPPEGIAQAVGLTVRSKIPETFAVIFDDVEFISESQSAVSFIDALIEATPEHTKFIMCGREVLEVSLAKLMANGDLAALGPHDLALTDDEAEALALSMLGKSIGAINPREVNRDLQGWITGLVLSIQSGSMNLGAGISGPQDIIYNYFASTVLNRTGDKLRRFMLESSVLPVLSPGAADRVLERDDSKELIEELAGERVFVHLTNASRGEYEYHPLFRQFLSETLKATGDSRHKYLARKSASYFANHGSTEWAVNLFLESESYTDAAALASKQAPLLFARGRFESIYKWLEQLGELDEELDDLRLWAASAHMEQGSYEQVLEVIEKMRARMGAPDYPASRLFRAHVYEGFSHLRQGDIESVENSILELEGLFPQLESGETSASLGSMFFRLKSDFERQRPEGDLEEAKRLASTALDFAQDSGLENQIGQSFHQVSLLQSLTGDFVRAAVTGKKAIDLLRRHASPASLAGSMNNQAIRVFRQSDYEEAMKLLQEARGEARLAGSRTIDATVLITQAEIFGDLRMTIQAGELFEEGLRLAVESSDSYLTQEACVGSATLHRRNGTHVMAAKWLERAISLRGDRQIGEPPELVIERGALELAVNPLKSANIIDGLLRDHPNLDTYLQTKALFVKFHGITLAGHEAAAAQALEDCLDVAIATGSEQAVAAECTANRGLWDKMMLLCPDHPALGSIGSRINAMELIRDRWDMVDDHEQQPASHKVRVFAMGGSEVLTGEGVSIQDLKPQALELLFYLVDSQVLSKEAIISSFWPEYPSGRQNANLHMAIWSLRQALGKDAIILDGAAYRIAKDITEYYDVAEFERSARIADQLPEADPRKLFALTDAISRYQGPFLIEHESEWVEARRRAIDQRYLDLVASHADESLVRNDPSKSLQSLRTALEIDPYRDDLNVRYLRVLHRLGRRSEIVSHFDRYRRLIQADLGLDPPEAIREEYGQMLR